MTDSTDRTPTGNRQARDSPTLSVAEAAARLGVTPDAIRARLHRKTLSGEKVAGEWRVYLPVKNDNVQLDRPDTDRTPAVGRQDSRQDATGSKQESDRQGDSPSLVGQLIAAKDETIESQRDEIAFLRRELETRTDELQRRDVLLREALGRIPQLAPGETRGESQEASRTGQGEAIVTKEGSDTSPSETGNQARRWWERWKG